MVFLGVPTPEGRFRSEGSVYQSLAWHLKELRPPHPPPWWRCPRCPLPRDRSVPWPLRPRLPLGRGTSGRLQLPYGSSVHYLSVPVSLAALTLTLTPCCLHSSSSTCMTHVPLGSASAAGKCTWPGQPAGRDLAETRQRGARSLGLTDRSADP